MSAVVAFTGETRVNTTRTDIQSSPSVAVLANGGWVVTWQSFNQDGEGYGIYQQRYGANGQPVGGEIRVNTTTSYWQVSPSVTGLKDGGWLVTWDWTLEISGNPGLNYVSQQRYDADGWTVGGETQVSTDTARDKNYSSVAALANGGWVVTWQSSGQDGSLNGIYQQRYGADGHQAGGETRVNTTMADEQYFATVAALANGGWVVSWQSKNQDGEGFGIYQQRYDANGWEVGGETRVNTTTASDQGTSSVAGLPGGGWLVTWSSLGQDGSGAGIYQQRYGSDGTRLGGETQVNTTTSGHQTGAAVTALTGGGWLVTWQSQNQDESGYGVYQQRYDANGVKVGGEAQVNTFALGDQVAPTVTALPNGGWVVAWQSAQDGDRDGIFQQVYSPTGQQIGPATPTGITLPASSVSEGAPTARPIGQITVNALDPGQSFSYALLDDAGGRFALSATGTIMVKDGVRLDYEQAQLHRIKVEVRSTDLFQVAYQDWLTVTVTDVTSENLTGTVGNDVIKGGRYKDTFKGGSGNDKLWGGLGNDVLYGGTGRDIFVFDTKPHKKTNLDKIVDFNVKDDSFWLDNKIFAKLGKGTEAKPGKLNKAFFTIGDKAKDKNDYLVFNPKNGVLSYDIDGSGAKAAVEIAVLKKGLKLTYADFFVI